MLSPLNNNFKFWKLTEQGALLREKDEARLENALNYLHTHRQELDEQWGTPLAEKLIEVIDHTKILPEKAKLKQLMQEIRDHILLNKRETISLRGGNQELIVPRSTLIHRASVFKEMLESHMVEALTKKIELNEIPAEVIHPFFKYLETGACEITEETVLPLIQLADQYDCKPLLALLEAWFMDANIASLSLKDWLAIHEDIERFEDQRIIAIDAILIDRLNCKEGMAHLSPDQIAEARYELRDEELTIIGSSKEDIANKIVETGLQLLKKILLEGNHGPQLLSEARRWPCFQEQEATQSLKRLHWNLTHEEPSQRVKERVYNGLLKLDDTELELLVESLYGSIIKRERTEAQRIKNRLDYKKLFEESHQKRVKSELKILMKSIEKRPASSWHEATQEFQQFLKTQDFLNEAELAEMGKMAGKRLLLEASQMKNRAPNLTDSQLEWLGLHRTDFDSEFLFQQLAKGEQFKLNAEKFNTLVEYAQRVKKPELLDACVKWVGSESANFEDFPKMIAFAKENKITPLLRALQNSLNFWTMTDLHLARLFPLLQKNPHVVQELGFTKEKIMAEQILRNGLEKKDKQLFLNALEGKSRNAAFIIGMMIMDQKSPFKVPEFQLERSVEILSKATHWEGNQEIEMEKIYLALGDAYSCLLKSKPTAHTALQAQFAYAEALSRMAENTPIAKEVSNKMLLLQNAVQNDVYSDESLQHRLVKSDF